MQPLLRLALLASLFLVACASSPSDDPNPVSPDPTATRLSRGTRITILHVNDTHSHLDAIGPRRDQLEGTSGGLARAATVIAAAKQADPDTLLVHAGDFFQGTVYFPMTAGVAELSILSSLGLDAMTLGNHEFNLTPAALLGSLSTVFAPVDGLPDGTLAASPVVSSNLDFRNQSLDGLQRYVQRRLVKEVGGIRVGFFGLVTPDPAEQFRTEDPADPADPPAIDERFADLAAQEAAALRATPASADVVVLLSHLGIEWDRRLARTVQGIDAVISGHDHVRRAEVIPAQDGRRVPVVQAGAFYEWVGRLTLSVQPDGVRFEGHEFIPIDASVEPFVPVVALLSGEDGLRKRAHDLYAEDLFGEAIAIAVGPIEQDAPPRGARRDSPIANLITDAFRAAGGTDIALTCNGLLTEGLAPGALVRDDAFRIVGDGFDPENPFAFEAPARLGAPLYKVALRGDGLAQAVAYALSAGGDYFPQVSGMSIVFDPRDPGAPSIRIGEAPLVPETTYWITLGVALLDGLLPLVPEDAIGSVEPLGVTEYEAVRDWLLQQQVVHYESAGRVWDASGRS